MKTSLVSAHPPSAIAASILFGTLAAAAMGAPPVKKVLIEEFSSTSCGQCPPRSQLLKDWSLSSDRHLMVTHHANTNDNMSNSLSVAMGGFYDAFAQPTAMIDRKLMPGQGQVQMGLMDSARFFASAREELAAPAKVGIAFESLRWEAGTRTLSGILSAAFTAGMTGDFRVEILLVENQVTGGTGRPTMQGGVVKGNTTGVTAYDQLCYDVAWAKRTFPDLPLVDGDHIHHYPHFNVARKALLGDGFGKAGIIPATAVAEAFYKTPFSYAIPERYDPTPLGADVKLAEISLIAFVARYAAGLGGREILNSERVRLKDFAGPTAVHGAGKVPEPRSIRLGGKGRFGVDGRRSGGRRD